MILAASASVAGAQATFHPHFAGDAKAGASNPYVSEPSMTRLAQKAFGSVIQFLTGAGRDGISAESLAPGSAVLHEIPGHRSYRYAVVGEQRLIVDAATHSIVYKLK
jgi:hypothetical protein